MHSTNSYILTITERLRAYLDDVDVDAKYSNDWVCRHVIGPGHRDVIARINKASSSPVVLRFTITVTPGQVYYRLPPCVQEVLRLCVVDANRNVIIDVTPRDRMSYRGPVWALEGTPGALELYIPPTTVLVNGTAEIWYVSNGDMLPHYGTGTLTATSMTGLTWTESSKTLSKTGSGYFTDAQPGNRVPITGGTGATVSAYYVIATVVSADAVTLTTSIGAGADGQTNITGTAPPGRLMTLSLTPNYGVLDRRPGSYTGSVLRLLPAAAGAEPVEERIIDDHYFTAAATNVWKVQVRRPFLHNPGGSQVYEIAPGGSQALIDCIAAWGAMKLGTMRKITESHYKRIHTNYLASLKTAIDDLSEVQGRIGKSFVKDTGDNPLVSIWGWHPTRG